MSKKPPNVETFVVFGTAFPETTDKDRRAGRTDAGQFVPVWKQEARDEQGRRRFHGAFTGGFSAGYFNTVGSKEGWEPSNFVSSRSSRSDRKEAKPEDYMDEEDLQDMQGAKKLVATEEFDILGSTERELAARKKLEAEQENRHGGLDLLGSSLMGIFGPPKDSIGVKLLCKMGWKPGQGIGPRMKRAREEEEELDDGNLGDVTFAPRDTPIENFQAKRDAYGLGYDLTTSVPEVAEMKRLRELARQKQMSGAELDASKRSSFGVFDQGGAAFGLGVFDENDGEEDDVYGSSQSNLNNHHHALYDENESGFTRDEIKAQIRERKHKMEQETEKQKSKLKCSDGRPPLKGFIVSDQKQQIGKWHAPPKVPADFTGQHRSTHTAPKAANITNDNVFSFEERGNVLGEKPIESRSVFDYMPKHSKDRLDQAVSWFIDIGKDKSQLADFPSVTKEVANLALKGYMPFGDNLNKQKRYRDYLENQAGHLTDDGLPKKVLPIPEGLTYEAGMKEMDEFAKAARIFRPISAMMSGRFTSASESSKNVEVVNFEGGLKTEEQYRKEKEIRAQNEPPPEKKQLSQEAEAAAMNMFGNLTRTVKPFYPNRLVCKRFNVKNPHPNHDPTADADVGRSQAGSKDALSKESMDTLLNERLPLKFTSSTSTVHETKSDDPLLNAVIPKPSDRTADDQNVAPTTGVDKETTYNKPTNDEEEDEGPALDYERPSIDVFKAIFDDSSDNDSEEEQEVEKSVEPAVALTENEFIGPPLPPPVATIDIPLETKKVEESFSEPFRPMFKRASERKEKDIPMTHIISEEVVVQPFKPRINTHKRRHVAVSDDEVNEEEERYHRSSSRHHKSSRHKASKSKERDEESSSRRERKSKSSRKRSRSPNDRKHRSKSPNNRKRKSSKRSSRSNKLEHASSRKEEEYDYDAMWVEKEYVIPLPSDSASKTKKDGRKSAADMWS